MGKKPKIVIIGPVKPWRGGIAQYTEQLSFALNKLAYVKIISFKRLYPLWLYPGSTNKEKDTDFVKNADYTLDIYSPRSVLNTIHQIKKMNTDLVLIDWWTILWQPGMAYISLRLRRKGIKTVFICHNVFDHDASFIKQYISKKLLRQADGYIVHSTEQANILSEINNKAKIINRIMPIFGHYPKSNKSWQKRGRLEVLFFGFIRPYKGLDVLLEAFNRLNDKEVFLTVVGEVWGDKDKLLQKIRKSEINNIDLNLKFVGENMAANYFNRADLVAIPYLSATGSAVAALAYGYRKPVLATKVGGLQDAVIDKQTGWLVDPGSSAQIAEVLHNLNREVTNNMFTNIDRYCNENSWLSLAKHIIDNFAET